MRAVILASVLILQVIPIGKLGPTSCRCERRPRHAGFVTGLDMTDEMLEVAEAHSHEYTTKLGYAKPNIKFVKGYIERLHEAGIADESIDMIISNCVVNLSPDKPSVLREAFRVLAPGGELYFSDVYCDRRLPESVQKHEVCCTCM
jgi:arsenite methyltransferase